MTNSLDLLGRSAIIKFDSVGATAEVSYSTDAMLDWKLTDQEGAVTNGTETMSYYKIADGIHFISWIEETGFTVSQIVDANKGTVKAFWSFADEASPRGGRTSLFLDGSVQFI